MAVAEECAVRLQERRAENNEAYFQIDIRSSSTFPPLNYIGLSAVIEFSNSEKSYWALTHPGPNADFHNKDGWASTTR